MTLSVSMTALMSALLYAGILGVMYGLVYDAVRLLRMLCGTVYKGRFIRGVFSRIAAGKLDRLATLGKRKAVYRRFLSVLEFLTDVLFFIFCGVSYSIFLYWTNHGIFRIGFVISTIIGFFLYRRTVGKLVFLMLLEVYALLLLTVYRLYRIIRAPLRLLYRYAILKIIRLILLLFRKMYGIIGMGKSTRRKRSDMEGETQSDAR